MAPRRADTFRTTLLLLACLAPLLLTGCSIKHMAANGLADALAGTGGAFASDDDPQLIREATPFSLKLIESVLAETPKHRGLLEAASRGFTQYAYAFLQQDADELETRDIAAANLLRGRIRRLYLRARDYGLRGLALDHKNVLADLRKDPKAAAARIGKRDIGLAYWTAAAWGAAISISKDNPDLIADQPIVEALIDRALALDETYDEGAIHTFLITYEMVRPGAGKLGPERAKKHFDRAMERGAGAGALVAYAESVCLQAQNRAEFEALLKQALAINADAGKDVDADAKPDRRMVTLILQQRARWLLGRVDDLFLE
ncbi:MAG: TRAP transporter TatT component family protein [Planctomycetota bacterium]|nr:TRAP transporter TatT component family protein [Planctomycetota bacterium]